MPNDSQTEHTPLLGQDRRRSSRRRSSALVVVEDFDGNELVRHRSRLSSHPVIDNPENALKEYEHEDLSNNTMETAAEQSARDGETTEPEPNDEPLQPERSNSKYMHVGPGRFWLVFLTVLLGYFVACFDVTLMASIHPIITSYFQKSSLASWLTTSFMITNTGFQPLWGRLSDTVGRKNVYLGVLAIFALTNLWCALAQSIGSFIAARAVCGIGAGGTMSLGLVVTNDLVKIEHRGVFISHINVAFGLGAASGAAFGGVLSDAIGWRWAFGIQVPVIAVCAMAVFFVVPGGLGPELIKRQKGSSGESQAWKAVKSFDNLGVVTLVLAVACLILFLNLGGNEYPWDHPIVITSLVLGILLSTAVVWVELRAKQPIMPIYLLSTRPYAELVFANFLAGIASNTVLFNAPLWFQAVELDTPSVAGLRLTAPAIGGSIAGVLTGYIITYSRRLKPMLIFGSAVYLAGSMALFFIDKSMPLAVQNVLVTPTPLSQGFVYPASMLSAFAVSASEEQAVVTTTLSLWRNLGIVAGVAISSLVFQNALTSKLTEFVKGPKAEYFVALARNNVRSIGDIPQPYQRQIIDSYAVALKLSFVTAIGASAILFLMVVPIRLPRLKQAMSVSAGE